MLLHKYLIGEKGNIGIANKWLALISSKAGEAVNDNQMETHK